MSDEYGKTKVAYDWEHRRQYLVLPFPMKEYQRRVDALRRSMNDAGLEYLIIYGNPACTGPIYYIANFDSFFGNTIVFLPASGDPVLITDGIMHSEPMHSGIWTTWIRDIRPANHPATVRHTRNLSDFIVDELKRLGLSDAPGGLISAGFFPYTFMQRLNDLLPDIQLSPAEAVFERVRSIKSDLEVALLRRTAKIASLGLDHVFSIPQAGMTEKQLAAEAVRVFLEEGAEFPLMVAVTAGVRAGLKHASPTDQKIKNGDMIFVDVGTPVSGYFSDVARSGVAGKANQQQIAMFKTALEMHDRVIAAIKPGARICDLQRIAEEVARTNGFANYYYPTGFGHGIGTSVAETPILFPDNEAALEKNMVFALEPMIVIEGVGTAVFEEMILVTSESCEVLSDATLSTWK
ncbi:MAG: aminopeptidase P family protein [Anaerolineales bacterium]|nr:aminopeptidase P family protein [Anaerolineales bacterium]